MEKNNTSRFSICRKIRQTLSSINPAFGAIHRIKQYSYLPEPRPVITRSNPQHINVNREEEGAIPIKFDYSTPTTTTTGNGNKAISMMNGQSSKVVSPHVGASERTGKVAAKIEPQTQNGVGMQHLEQQGKKKLDLNDTFTEYIQRAKYRIRTVSNVGRGQNNSALDEANGSVANNMENQNDQFSDFIRHAKKKIRTTSNVGKTSSLERG